jgi:hypothetical protein
MGIREDREEFNTTGLRGLVRKLMIEKEEAYIRILAGGWQGEEVQSRPLPGSGPYIHYKKGDGVYKYTNAYDGDTRCQPFRFEI